jgi:hypothetical protein
LNVNVLGTKTRGSKGLISYKIENGIFAMKKIVECEHIDIAYMYFNEVAL